MSTAPKSQNITWSHSQVTREERRKLLGHGAATVWFTGLSGSGKSTIAKAVEKALLARGVSAYILDGDNILLAKKGETIQGKFKVLDIGVEWADIGYVDPELKDQKKRIQFGL